MLTAMSKAPEASCALEIGVVKTMDQSYGEVSSCMSLANKGAGGTSVRRRCHPDPAAEVRGSKRFFRCQSQLVKHSVDRRRVSPWWNHFRACRRTMRRRFLRSARERVADRPLDRNPVAAARVTLRSASWRRTRGEVQIEVRYSTVHLTMMRMHFIMPAGGMSACMSCNLYRNTPKKVTQERATATAAVVSPIQTWPVQREEGRD